MDEHEHFLHAVKSIKKVFVYLYFTVCTEENQRRGKQGEYSPVYAESADQKTFRVLGITAPQAM